MMTNFTIEQNIEKLADLETIDRETFLSNEDFNQEFCDLILALSMIWNDYKTLMLFHEHIGAIISGKDAFDKPEEMPEEAVWGERSGIRVYVEKSLLALVYEFFALLRKSEDIITSQSFGSLLKKMHPKYQKEWKLMVRYASQGGTSKTPLGKALIMTRNKIVNHYDKREMMKGYKRKFFEQDFKPLMSAGKSMNRTRFYFADAAAQEYYHSHVECIGEDKFFENLNIILGSINTTINSLVQIYIRTRSKQKPVAEESG